MMHDIGVHLSTDAIEIPILSNDVDIKVPFFVRTVYIILCYYRFNRQELAE